MTKKDGNPRPAKGKKLMDRLEPVFTMADKLGPINQDIDGKTLSDWICGDDEPLNANVSAAVEAQSDHGRPRRI